MTVFIWKPSHVFLILFLCIKQCKCRLLHLFQLRGLLLNLVCYGLWIHTVIQYIWLSFQPLKKKKRKLAVHSAIYSMHRSRLKTELCGTKDFGLTLIHNYYLYLWSSKPHSSILFTKWGSLSNSDLRFGSGVSADFSDLLIWHSLEKEGSAGISLNHDLAFLDT